MPTLPVSFAPSSISSISSWRARSAAPSKPASVSTIALRVFSEPESEPPGQRDGLVDAGRPVGRGDRIDRLAQGALMVGHPAGDPRLRTGRDDRQLVAQPEAVDQPAGLGLGRFQPGRQHVGGVHAGRVVHDQHQPARPRLLPPEDRVGQGEHQQRQEGQLQVAARSSAAASARATAASSPRRSAPRTGGRDRQPTQPDLQDVEGDDRHRQCAQDQRGRMDQVHASAPAARIIRSSSSSNGISVAASVPPIPYALQ